MNILLLVALLLVLLIIVLLIIRLFTKKNNPQDSNIKIGFFHPNGNLDFYLTKDEQFVSRINNTNYPLDTIAAVKAKVDEQVVFQKTAQNNSFDQSKIDQLFQQSVKHITYEFDLKNGAQFEAVVDVASNNSKKQRQQLNESLLKLINLLNEMKLT